VAGFWIFQFCTSHTFLARNSNISAKYLMKAMQHIKKLNGINLIKSHLKTEVSYQGFHS
jgi:hypothetical protein